MRKILIAALFLVFAAATAQKAPKGMVKIDMPVEAKIDTITTDFRVVSIVGETARIMTTNAARFYDVPVTPELNPFGYVLEIEREYRVALEVDRNLIYDKQTRGQTGIVPARMIYFTVSGNQLGKDMRMLKEHIEAPAGYDVSPRYQ